MECALRPITNAGLEILQLATEEVVRSLKLIHLDPGRQHGEGGFYVRSCAKCVLARHEGQPRTPDVVRHGAGKGQDRQGNQQDLPDPVLMGGQGRGCASTEGEPAGPERHSTDLLFQPVERRTVVIHFPSLSVEGANAGPYTPVVETQDGQSRLLQRPTRPKHHAAVHGATVQGMWMPQDDCRAWRTLGQPKGALQFTSRTLNADLHHPATVGSAALMWNRILLIARTHLSGEWLGERGARLPIAPILFQASLSAVLCLLVRDHLEPRAFAVFALSLPLGLTAIALLGELGPLLRADPAAEWVAALPVKPGELRAARILVLAVLLGGLALGSLIPAALLAPEQMVWWARFALVVGGLLQTLFVGALLLWVQAGLAGRAEGVLTAIQTILFCGVIVGLTAGLGNLPDLQEAVGKGTLDAYYPPLWFTAPLAPDPTSSGLWLALAATLLTLATFALAPFPPAPRARPTRSPLGILLWPLRVLAARYWVRPRERASFEFVYHALPSEQDFVTRAYPLLAVPLAFLLLGADGSSARDEGLLALLLFAPAVYLPLLLLYVPATATPEARWIVDTCPLDTRDEAAGSRKAVVIRMVLPLYLALGALVAWRGNVDLAMRLTPVALTAGLLLLRTSWDFFAGAPPLSMAPSELGTAWDDTRSGRMFMIAILMTFAAIGAWQFMHSVAMAFSILAVVLVADRLPTRHDAQREMPPGPAPGGS